MFKKIIIQLTGFFIVALGIVGIIFSRLGASPIDAFNYFIYTITPLSLGTITVISGFVAAVICYAFDRDKSIIFSVLFLMSVGIFVDGWKYIFEMIPYHLLESYTVRIPMALLSLILIAFGVSLTLSTGLMMAPYEQLMLIINRKIHHLGFSKMIIEGTFLLFAVSLGIYTKQLWDQVFVMTLVIALLNGPLTHLFINLIKHRKGEIRYESQ